MGAFCCPNVWNLWIIPSIEVCYSDLQGLFYKILFFWFRLSEKTNVGAFYHMLLSFWFFLTFLNFKLRTYLFNRHFTWLIVLFSKLTKNIFYFNKFFLSKFESNLTGVYLFVNLLISKNTKLYWYFKVVLNFKYIIGVIWGFWLNSTLTSKYFWILHPKLISFWYEIRS